ncbi:hypothetical protein [Picrophilus oshimae]|uniref:Uncharacterized protein n=1 Tax=Picrophilus torridus (strain ATCC 700027 / DSM 9790 / JCM 10055 / NBRC 100828 / KAW 2/3) TaxID=1122961 RepID=A0A8G2FWQ2_PICTO|nr:hypothetical protein [Picrophilus oshimae]SMD30905.1 hypothetical protein SAMN02745355_0823 [Picrophilus oshimae DSM 9789]
MVCSIDKLWKIPLGNGGIYRLSFDNNKIAFYRVFSGKYIEEKLKPEKYDKVIMSMDVPTAMDPLMPEELYSKINEIIEYFSDEYNKKILSKGVEKSEMEIKNEKIVLKEKNGISNISIGNENFILLGKLDIETLNCLKNMYHDNLKII